MKYEEQLPELPNTRPVIPEIKRKSPSLPPEVIQGILDEINREEDPGASEGIVHNDHPDIPNIDTLIERKKR